MGVPLIYQELFAEMFDSPLENQTLHPSSYTEQEFSKRAASQSAEQFALERLISANELEEAHFRDPTYQVTRYSAHLFLKESAAP